jgi:hypothetical protein
MKQKTAVILLIFPSILIYSFILKVDDQIKRNQNTFPPRLSELYKVYKLDSINSYYLIYTKRNDSFFKIVSKKEVSPTCYNIKLNAEYSFILSSIWRSKFQLNGKEVSLPVSPIINCMGFDDSTTICLERDSINDLYYADNIKGLCFINK